MAEIKYTYNGSQTVTTSTRQFNLSWTKPDASYELDSVWAGFTTSSSEGYDVTVTRYISGTPHDVKRFQSWGSSAGEKELQFDDMTYFNGVSAGASDTVLISLRRPGLSGYTQLTYSNIYLKLVYHSVASESTVVISTNCAIGEAQTVTLTNSDSTIKHRVTWTYGAGSNVITSGEQSYNASTRSVSYTIPHSTAAEITAIENLISDYPNRSTVPAVITVRTLTSTNVVVGTTSYSTTINIPSGSSASYDATPNVNVSLAWNPDEATHYQNLCAVTVTVTATGKYGATISQIAVSTPDGNATIAQSGGSATFNVTKTGANNQYNIDTTVTDSRGIVATVNATPTVLPYGPPSITLLTAERCLQDGTLDGDGKYVKISVSATTISGITISEISYAIRRSGSNTVLYSGSESNPQSFPVVFIAGNDNINVEQSYNIAISVQDSNGTTSKANTYISSTLYTIHRMVGGKGVAFGMASERYGVEVTKDWPFYVHDQEIIKLIMDYAHPVGSIIESIDENFDPNQLWKWTQWGKALQDDTTLPPCPIYYWVRVN